MVSVVRHRYNVIVRRMVKKGGRGGRERKYAEREEDRMKEIPLLRTGRLSLLVCVTERQPSSSWYI